MLGKYDLQFTGASSSTMSFNIRANKNDGKTVKITKCSFSCEKMLERDLVASTNSKYPASDGWWEASQITGTPITMYFKETDGGIKTLYYNSDLQCTSM